MPPKDDAGAHGYTGTAKVCGVSTADVAERRRGAGLETRAKGETHFVEGSGWEECGSEMRGAWDTARGLRTVEAELGARRCVREGIGWVQDETAGAEVAVHLTNGAQTRVVNRSPPCDATGQEQHAPNVRNRWRAQWKGVILPEQARTAMAELMRPLMRWTTAAKTPAHEATPLLRRQQLWGQEPRTRDRQAQEASRDAVQQILRPESRFCGCERHTRAQNFANSCFFI